LARERSSNRKEEKKKFVIAENKTPGNQKGLGEILEKKDFFPRKRDNKGAVGLATGGTMESGRFGKKSGTAIREKRHGQSNLSTGRATTGEKKPGEKNGVLVNRKGAIFSTEGGGADDPVPGEGGVVESENVLTQKKNTSDEGKKEIFAWLVGGHKKTKGDRSSLSAKKNRRREKGERGRRNCYGGQKEN